MKQENSPKKLNFVDYAIIVIILAVIAFAGFKYLGPKSAALNTKMVTMTFYAEELSDFVAQQIKAGDHLLDDTTNVSLGYVKSVEKGLSKVYVSTQDGRFVQTTKEGSCSITIVGEVEGVPDPNGCMIKNVRYGVGHSMTLRAGKAKIYLRVKDISY